MKTIYVSLLLSLFMFGCSADAQEYKNLFEIDLQKASTYQPSKEGKIIQETQAKAQMAAFQSLLSKEVLIYEVQKDGSKKLVPIKIEKLLYPDFRPNCADCDQASIPSHTVDVKKLTQLLSASGASYINIAPSLRMGNSSPVLRMLDQNGDIIPRNTKTSESFFMDEFPLCPPPKGCQL